MPTYDYKCQNKECGFKFEALQSIKSTPLKECPKCGKELKRLIYARPFLMDTNPRKPRFK